MPLFEYRCGKCRSVFESYRRPSEDASSEKCPACGEKADKVEVSRVSAAGGGGAAPASGGSCGGGSFRSPFR